MTVAFHSFVKLKNYIFGKPDKIIDANKNVLFAVDNPKPNNISSPTLDNYPEYVFTQHNIFVDYDGKGANREFKQKITNYSIKLKKKFLNTNPNAEKDLNNIIIGIQQSLNNGTLSVRQVIQYTRTISGYFPTISSDEIDMFIKQVIIIAKHVIAPNEMLNKYKLKIQGLTASTSRLIANKPYTSNTNETAELTTKINGKFIIDLDEHFKNEKILLINHQYELNKNALKLKNMYYHGKNNTYYLSNPENGKNLKDAHKLEIKISKIDNSTANNLSTSTAVINERDVVAKQFSVDIYDFINKYKETEKITHHICFNHSQINKNKDSDSLSFNIFLDKNISEYERKQFFGQLTEYISEQAKLSHIKNYGSVEYKLLQEQDIPVS